MYINTNEFFGFFLIVLRMSGILILNPITGRTNVPARINIGLALFLGILVYGVIPVPALPVDNFAVVFMLLLKELLVGAAAGLVFRMFFSILAVGGEIIDMQIGISMAKAFDPGSNASVSITSSMMNAIYILTFFATNNHLTFISMMVHSFRLFPVGSAFMDMNAFYFLPSLLSSVFTFALKLALPIVVVEVIVTLAGGIIMRIIPQINVFVVNIQLKMLAGFLVLVMLVPGLTVFIENLIALSFENIQEAWLIFRR